METSSYVVIKPNGSRFQPSVASSDEALLALISSPHRIHPGVAKIVDFLAAYFYGLVELFVCLFRSAVSGGRDFLPVEYVCVCVCVCIGVEIISGRLSELFTYKSCARAIKTTFGCDILRSY